MGFETRLQFELNPLKPVTYAPHEFLLQLDTDPPSLECNGGDHSVSSDGAYEYRPRGEPADAWPAVVIYIEPGGFLVLENDRRVGAKLLGPLMAYALRFARDERVTLESV